MRRMLVGLTFALALVVFWPHGTVTARRRALPGSSCSGSVTDAFTRTAANLGGNYTNWSVAGAIFTTDGSQAVSAAAQQFGGGIWTADSFNTAQCAKVKLTHAGGGSGYAGVTANFDSTAHGYGLLCNNSLIRLEKFTGNAAVPTTLGSNLTGTCAINDVIMIQSSGNSSTMVLEGFLNGSSLGTRSDSSSPYTGRNAGLYTYSGLAGDMTLDDLTVDNMTVTSTYPAAIINAPIRGGGR